MFRKSVLLLLILGIIASPHASAMSAQSAVLIDAGTGRVLLEENAHERRGMASTTKIMTAIVAIERGVATDIVTVSRRAANTEGSSIWLREGETITLQSLLYGLMLNSGNDAATAIAEHVGGSMEGFVAMMNQKAKQLGLSDTLFTNPHGLDGEQHYTTAYDLAQIARYALQNETFAQIVSTQKKTVERDGTERGRLLSNHNKMLTLYQDADGVKTGFTKKSGRCLVSSATRDGLQLIAVTLSAPDDWDDHTEMLNYGFSKYQNQMIVQKGDYVKTIPLREGRETTASACAAQQLCVAVTAEEAATVETKLDVPSHLEAPIQLGQHIGTLSVFVRGEKVGQTDLVAPVGVERSVRIAYWDKLHYLILELLSNFCRYTA